MFSEGDLLKQRYRLERVLGRGGMASVWRGHDEVLERPVAVKILSDTIASDPEFVARFRREARTAAGVSHPNLVGVYDYSDGEERPYLVMQFVPGEDLGSILAREGHVDCQRLARELLEALAHIHAVGIIHRDVKPSNVLIEPDGTAKLIDFGIAQAADATSLTRTGLILGTERYAAPEVMEGKPATERSDLYSCGVLLRSCMSGPGSSPAGLVEWLTSADPAARPASARQALARLDRPRAGGAEATRAYSPTFARRRDPATPAGENRPEGPPPRIHRQSGGPHRGRWIAAAAILGVLAAIVAVVAIAGSGGGAPAKQTANAAKGNGGAEKKQAAAITTDESTAASEEPESTEAGAPAAAEGTDPERGSALNQEGYELIQSGDYQGAVPILEEAVRSFPPGSEELDYAYALFNLGNALRLSGHPEEAIPVLERRLEFPNQTGVVRRELAAAQAEAG